MVALDSRHFDHVAKSFLDKEKQKLWKQYHMMEKFWWKSFYGKVSMEKILMEKFLMEK